MIAFFRVIYIFLIILSTFWVMILRPGIPKVVIIENHDFSLAQTELENKNVSKSSSTVKVADNSKVAAKPAETKRKYVSPESLVSDSNNWIFQQKEQPKTSKTKTVNVSPQKDNNRTVNVNTPKIQPSAAKIVLNSQKSEKKPATLTDIMEKNEANPNYQLTPEEIVTVIKSVTGNNISYTTDTPKQTTQTAGEKQLTESEEIIAWNIWRANFQNTVMRNSGEIPAPIGTAFLYSCVVDKYGNISNINVWSSNPNYTPMAKQYVKNAIVGMQRTAGIKFPQGTRRKTVVAEGSFVMSTSDRFASPNYYSDYERVKVQR